MYSHEFDMEIPAPRLTEDDAFGSFPLLGSITYRLPSVAELMGMPMAYFDKYQTMTFEMRILADDADMGIMPMNCKNVANCKVVYQK